MAQDIIWKRCHSLQKNRLPPTIKHWLLDRGSLTERLIAASGGDFRVQVLSQRWQCPKTDEALLLGMKPREYALVREVLLLCHGEPWVYARSVIPHQSLTGPLRFLRRLQNQALGGLLFSDPFLERSHFDIAHIRLPHEAIPVTSDPCDIYGRRSRFLLKNQPLLVAEIFLPDCKLGGSGPQPR